MDACAIDISDRSIKYGELSHKSSGLSLVKYGKEKIPEGTIVSGKIEKEDELIRILKKIKEKENLRFIRVSLPEEQTYLFTISVPKTENENLRDVILLQIEEYIPLKAVDSVFDFDVIKEDDQNIILEVVAISNTVLESYLSVFKKVGLIPITFEIEAQAIARAVIPFLDNNPVMIVDFGDARTGVSISKNGRVFLTTTLSIGGSDLTNMIAKNFSLSFDEAEKMKQEYGVEESSKAKNIFPAILNGLSVLRDELNKQIIYWENHSNDNEEHGKIDRIILCGGDANLAGLSDYLELTMKIKVENANVWVNIFDTKNSSSVPEISFEKSLSYATVLGLSLGGYIYKSEPVINILPQREKKIIHREYWIRFSTIVFSFVALSSAVASLLLFPSYFLSRLKENLVEEKLAIFNKENPNLADNNLDNITNDINLNLKIINRENPSYQISDKILGNILSSRTDGITFSQILFNKKSGESSVLEVYGVADTRDHLRNFKIALDNNSNFSEVDLPISDFLEKEDLDFTISITIND
jgi:type IV pilus assembly protein PilM